MTFKHTKSRISYCLLSVSILAAFSAFAAQSEKDRESTAEQDDHHKKISQDRIYYFEQQEVTVDDFQAEGFILDLGGGGEGIIGRLKGSRVIAVDISKAELEGAPDGPLKIIMDATELKFLDNTFGTATSFFTLMYIGESDLQKVFNEVLRVLKPGGKFMIWDVLFPGRRVQGKDITVFPLKIGLPQEEVATGYGMRWPEKGRGLSHYLQLAENAGFSVTASQEKDRIFYLELKKP